jgi:hypothetical protein
MYREWHAEEPYYAATATQQEKPERVVPLVGVRC